MRLSRDRIGRALERWKRLETISPTAARKRRGETVGEMIGATVGATVGANGWGNNVAKMFANVARGRLGRRLVDYCGIL